MARPLRVEFPGAVYHVTSQGNARKSIYLSDSDRYDFLDIRNRAVERYAPSLFEVIGSVSADQISRYSDDTIQLVRSSIALFESEKPGSEQYFIML